VVTDYDSYNITTYIEKRKKERNKKRKRKKEKEKLHYNEQITEKPLLSDFFIEEKYSRVKLKKSNEMDKRLPISIPIIVISSILMRDILS